MSIRAVPQIANPESVSDSAIRYGYVAYHDIALGNDHQVQPDTSPYHKLIPCRELIPFQDMPVTEIDTKKYGEGGTFNRQNVSPVSQRMKSAKDCAQEIEQSYEMWAFTVLRPINGFDTDRAFRIFQTVQPFPYLLKDIEAALDDAESRIESEVPYQVAYQGEVVDLRPLDEADKAVAKEVLILVKRSASAAVQIATDKMEMTIESMNSRFSGGEGKRVPDPLDKYHAQQLGRSLPTLITANEQQAYQQPAALQQAPAGLSPEEIALKQRELDQKDRELALEEKKLELEMAKLNPPPPMATAPSGARKCAGVKTDGGACGAYAVTDSDFCVTHNK